MKTGGIVVCSTLVALVYIPEYSYGRSVTHTFRAWPRPVWRMPPLLTAGLSQLFSFVRVDSDRHFSESMVLASLSPPSFELVHSLGDPLLSRSSVCSSFRPVSEISAHCSHLRGSSHLDSTRTLVPRPLIRKNFLPEVRPMTHN